MFISITDFDMEKTDYAHILITLIDGMGEPEETKRFDKKTNYDFGKWIQVGFFISEEGSVDEKRFTLWGQMAFQIPFLFYDYNIDKSSSKTNTFRLLKIAGVVSHE